MCEFGLGLKLEIVWRYNNAEIKSTNKKNKKSGYESTKIFQVLLFYSFFNPAKSKFITMTY